MKRFVTVLVLALLALLALGTAVVMQLRASDSSSAVAVDDAAELAGVEDDELGAEIDPGLRPTAGTYEYTGGGTEHLTLLGGSTHEFPERIAAVVQLDPTNDCAWSLDLVLIEEHVEHRTYCTTETGVLDRGFDRTTTFMGREQTSTYTCSNTALRAKGDAKVGDTWTWTCTERRGGRVTYTATRRPDETITIDGTPTRTTHVHVTARQRDKSTGNERSDWWLLDTGLPARIDSDRTLTTTAGPLGEMTTTEQFRYQLASLDIVHAGDPR